MSRYSLSMVLIVLAWSLYVLALFFPAIAVKSYSPDGGSGLDQASGGDCLEVVLNPLLWIVLPHCFLYAGCNLCMGLSPLFWFNSWNNRRRSFVGILCLAFLVTLTVPAWVENVYVGFFLWSGSFVLAMVAFRLSLPAWSDLATE